MEPTSKVCRKPEVLFSDLGDKIMMMSMKSGNYHELDQIGSLVWREIEAPVEIATLQKTFSARYNVPADECLADIVAFLGDLSELDLITVDP